MCVLFICFLILEKHIISKMVYYIEKLKTVRHNSLKDHESKVMEMCKYGIQINCVYPVEEKLCRIEITEEIKYRYFAINRIFLQDMLIENLVAIGYLFNVLIDGQKIVVLKRKARTGVMRSENGLTDYAVMKKYEEYLCRHKLRAVSFELYGLDGELDKVIRFSNKGKIEIEFAPQEKSNVDKQIKLWKKKCSNANIIL